MSDEPEWIEFEVTLGRGGETARENSSLRAGRGGEGQSFQ
jgi:hypothetical protein